MVYQVEIGLGSSLCIIPVTRALHDTRLPRARIGIMLNPDREIPR
jgi:hypothetical protein